MSTRCIKTTWWWQHDARAGSVDSQMRVSCCSSPAGPPQVYKVDQALTDRAKHHQAAHLYASSLHDVDVLGLVHGTGPGTRQFMYHFLNVRKRDGTG